MIENDVANILSAYVSANAETFNVLRIDAKEACVRLMWDVPLDPDVIDLPAVIDQVCRGV